MKFRLPNDLTPVLLLIVLIGVFTLIVARSAGATVDAIDVSNATVSGECPYLKVHVFETPGWWRRDDVKYQQPFREAFMAQLVKEGFEPVKAEEWKEGVPYWYLSTQVLDLEDGRIAWSWNFRKEPTVVNGKLYHEPFIDPVGGSSEPFGSVQGLVHLPVIEYEDEAHRAAVQLADVYLPHALNRCAHRMQAITEEIRQMEVIRAQLLVDMEEARAEQRRQRKLLYLEDEEAYLEDKNRHLTSEDLEAIGAVIENLDK